METLFLIALWLPVATLAAHLGIAKLQKPNDINCRQATTIEHQQYRHTKGGRASFFLSEEVLVCKRLLLPTTLRSKARRSDYDTQRQRIKTILTQVKQYVDAHQKLKKLPLHFINDIPDPAIKRYADSLFWLRASRILTPKQIQLGPLSGHQKRFIVYANPDQTYTFIHPKLEKTL